MASDPMTSWQIEGESDSSDRFPLLGLWNHLRQWLQPWNQKIIASWQENCNKPRQCVENQRHYSANYGLYSQGYGLPSGHVQLWDMDRKEGRTPWCLRAVVLEKTPESPLDRKEIKPGGLQWNQPWILVGRTDAEAEAPVFWSSGVSSWLIGKVPDAGEDWGQKEKRAWGWDGWVASQMQWTWTWANFGRWWGTRKSGVLQSLGLQRIRPDWVTEQ